MGDLEQHLEDAQQEIERLNARIKCDHAILQGAKKAMVQASDEIERLTALVHKHAAAADSRYIDIHNLEAELKQANAALRRIAHNICISDGADLEMRDIALAALKGADDG